MCGGFTKAFVLRVCGACFSGDPCLTRLEFKQFLVRTARLPGVVEVAEKAAILEVEALRKPNVEHMTPESNLKFFSCWIVCWHRRSHSRGLLRKSRLDRTTVGERHASYIIDPLCLPVRPPPPAPSCATTSWVLIVVRAIRYTILKRRPALRLPQSTSPSPPLPRAARRFLASR